MWKKIQDGKNSNTRSNHVKSVAHGLEKVLNEGGFGLMMENNKDEEFSLER